MPTDLYYWEDHGSLVHHCPKCHKPLTTPQARTRCLGEHVEWCRRYHPQLFKKGTSAQCAPCHNTDEQHQKRHREIAELIRKLALLSPATNSIANTLDGANSEDEGTPKTKKQRKAAKKAKKVSEMPKAVTATAIERIGRVLHPNDYDAEEDELEGKILEDVEINTNRYFHKGTSNMREIRNEFVKKDRKGDKVVFRVEAEEMEGLLQLLIVSPTTAKSSSEEKKIIEELKQKIEKDLLQAQDEKEELMMRKAGFWRWASKKAYNRLLEHGRIWEKGDGVLVGKTEESSDSNEGGPVLSTDSGDGTDDTNITEPDVDGGGEVAESIAFLNMTTPETPMTPKNMKNTTTAGGREDEEWTSVSKKKSSGKGKKATPKMTIKLSGNGGLAKMVQSSTPRNTSFLRYHEDERE